MRGQAGVGVTGGGAAYNPLPATLPSALPCAVPLSEQQALTVPLPPSVLYCWARRPPNDDALNDNGPALPPFRSLRFWLTFPCCATSLFVWPLLPHAAKASAAAPSPASPPPVSPPPAPANGVRVGWGAYSGGGGGTLWPRRLVYLPPPTLGWTPRRAGGRAGGRPPAGGQGHGGERAPAWRERRARRERQDLSIGPNSPPGSKNRMKRPPRPTPCERRRAQGMLALSSGQKETSVPVICRGTVHRRPWIGKEGFFTSQTEKSINQSIQNRM